MSEQFTNTINCGFPQIEGVPVGTKIARIGPRKIGEYVLTESGGIELTHATAFRDAKNFVIIVPDNIYGVIDLEAVPVPDRWERLYRLGGKICFRSPGFEDYWLNCVGGIDRGNLFINQNLLADTRRIIVRRKKTVKRYLVVRWEIADGARYDGPAAGLNNGPTISPENAKLTAGMRTGPQARIEEVED